MSRIGKQPIRIPDGVTVAREPGGEVAVKGPRGELRLTVPEKAQVEVGDGSVKIVCEVSSLQGLVRARIANAVAGVTGGWKKTLELSGTGYKAQMAGGQLQLALGFSHLIVIPAEEGIAFEVGENKITVVGVDKVKVGEVAAKIRHLKPADPYKAKGLKYEGEVIVRKAGKAAKAGGVAAK